MDKFLQGEYDKGISAKSKSEENQYDRDSSRKKLIDNALAVLVSADMQPFSIVEDSGFREFVRVLDPRYTLPSRKTLQHVYMKNIFEDLKTKLFTILDRVNSCAITADLWTSKANESYITATCHFITKDFVLRSVVLATKPLLDDSNHSAQNIASSLRGICDEWNIFDKIAAITTDNANSMIKACEFLQKRHLPCVAHTINLVVQSCLAIDCLQDILLKCKRIVTYFKSSSIALSKFKASQETDIKYSLIQEVPTRWNSAYHMIERILLTNEAISKVLLSTSKAPTPFTADEVAILKDIVQLLSPFDNATKQVSSSTSVTASLIVPIVCGLLHTLDSFRLKLNSFEGIEALNCLVDQVKKRLLGYEKRTFPKMSTLLDPRFKKQGFRSPFNADDGLHALENELAALKKVSPLDPPTPTEKESDCQQPLFEFVVKNISTLGRTNRVDAIVELQRHIHLSKQIL
ncbi:E3 SUMO-protein ligase ZBED1-like [Drosophila ananassae]|uniref:E3 SUMO-protein ligase ZBED1-like n=1 Tax=Drosophila ananassae TaxID=7217 RepID=UPI001CFFF6F4|nr:E3 SUMO-protein ligase ZBED1-like [Drosophila ananassae]